MYSANYLVFLNPTPCLKQASIAEQAGWSPTCWKTHDIGFLATKLIILLCCMDLSRIKRKPAFCICKNKDADQLHGNRAADQCLFFFASQIVQSLYFLNPKFRASDHLLWLYSPVCVGTGRKQTGFLAMRLISCCTL